MEFEKVMFFFIYTFNIKSIFIQISRVFGTNNAQFAPLLTNVATIPVQDTSSLL